MQYHYTPIGMRKRQNTNCWQRCEVTNSHTLPVGYSWAVSQKVKHMPILWSNYATSMYLPKKNESMSQTYSWMFITALFCNSPKWKQLKCPSTGQWMNKIWNISTVEFYSATKRNKLLIRATAWMNLNYTEVKEARGKKKDILYDSIYVKL